MSDLSPATYYRDPAVRARIREYCGAAPGGEPTCVFVTPLPPGHQPQWETAPHRPSSELEASLDDGFDLGRSMWDRASLLVHLDIDYLESTLAGEALLRPGHAFLRLEPLYRTIRFELHRLTLPLLDLTTGRGYHFTGRIPLEASVVNRLASLGLPAASSRSTFRAGGPDLRQERAFAGVGLALEYFAHLLIRRTIASAVPLVLNGTEVGRGGIGHEAISIDLSSAGDPLETRQIRVAFGTYQNHLLRPDIFGAEAAAVVPPLAAVPRGDRALTWMLEHARRLDQARALAARERVELPDVTHGMERLLDEYDRSALADFHRDFYAVAPHPPASWPDTYDRLDFRSLVPCVAWPFVKPNDALLEPTALQHVTRALMSAGWHPRHIAGLVHSKYAGDFAWGDRWSRMDPARRADYDVRVFAGLVAAGTDRAIDFNCVSAQEKGLCPRGVCDHDLRHDQARLLQQVTS